MTTSVERGGPSEMEQMRAARAILVDTTSSDTPQTERRKVFAGLSIMHPELSLETRLKIAYESSSLQDWETAPKGHPRG